MATIISGDYEWEDAKAKTNVAVHDGVTFEQAAAALDDPNILVLPENKRHPENVHQLVSHPDAGVLLVVTTVGDDQRTRIISARRVTGKQRALYQAPR